MRKKDDSKKLAILEYIDEYYSDYGQAPTVRAIFEGTGIAVATVHRYLLALKKSGELDYNGRNSITTERIDREVIHHAAPGLDTLPAARVRRRLRRSLSTLASSPINPTLPKEPSACKKRLSRILEHANCKHVRFHDLRHTFATMALENGIDIKTVASLLGYSTVATSINTYIHTTDEMRRSAASKIDRKIGGVEPSNKVQASEQPNAENAPKSKFEAYKGKKRKPGTGYVKQLSQNCWQGRYTPTINGKRTSYNVYAPTEAECEEKLAELIKNIKEEREEKNG